MIAILIITTAMEAWAYRKHDTAVKALEKHDV